ncbi:MAG: UbiA prenyltransferase family protein [Candidatus Omnitrophica bacterium]|nr:UbiA prenyltransferase family protein [Candidatus Omnitrophota bacterium]
MTVPPLVAALRPRDWLKNVAVALPILWQMAFTGEQILLLGAVAVVLFSAVASGAYLINDWLDRKADRLHPTKRLRPLAAGSLNSSTALGTAAVLVMGSLGIAVGWHRELAAALLVYFIAITAYSLWLKRIPVVDLAVIAGFLLLRVQAGAVVAGWRVPAPIWWCLGGLGVVIAAGKRRNELLLLKRKAGRHRPSLDRYTPAELDRIVALAAVTALAGYGWYLSSMEGQARLGRWGGALTGLLTAGGLARYIHLIHQRRKSGEPARLILSDRPLLWLAAGWLAVILWINMTR